VDRANGAALQVMAAVRAYQRAHGSFPVDLRDALAEVGLDWPIDAATGRPVGYRVERGRPVAWLAGFDGRDDGGQLPYLDILQATIAPGTDLVYRFGEPPPTLRPLVEAARPNP